MIPAEDSTRAMRMVEAEVPTLNANQAFEILSAFLRIHFEGLCPYCTSPSGGDNDNTEQCGIHGWNVFPVDKPRTYDYCVDCASLDLSAYQRRGVERALCLWHYTERHTVEIRVRCELVALKRELALLSEKVTRLTEVSK